MDHDEAAFRALHAATCTDLMRFVKRRVPDDDADDVVSATFAIAWRRWKDLPADARPWLFGIARNILANQARTLVRRRVVDVRMVADSPTAEADRSPGVDARVDLVRAWWSLRPSDREVLALVAFDGLTDVQAAAVLNCRRATFRMRLNRARTRLRAALEPAPAPAAPWESAAPAEPWSRA